MKDSIKAAVRNIFSKQGAIVAAWAVFIVISFAALDSMAGHLREREKGYMKLWAFAMERIGDFESDQMVRILLDGSNNIPFIMTNDRGFVEFFHPSISTRVIDNPLLLERQLGRFARTNTPIEIRSWNGTRHWVFYGQSRTLQMLAYFPVAQAIAFIVLLWLGLANYRSGKMNQQNRVWVGLAKETAHQLGTPTSSLLGWIEYLKTQPVEQDVVEEMGKDLTHLMKIADRFSKIGSETPLSPANINEVVGETVMYFRKRIPKNVEISYNGLAMAPVRARINQALFEWVVENLLKNALDALQGRGRIDVRISHSDKQIFIDVADTGRGIPRANWKKIFEPGFSTKTRGWGLGLSLSRRVIEEYHKGKIFVSESEVGKGTTIRVVLKMLQM